MQTDDLSRSLAGLDQDSTLIAVVELSLKSWLVAGLVPGVARQPVKKLDAKPELLVALVHRWRDEAVKGGRATGRITVAFEAGRDGFWLARYLRARGIEAHVIHSTSIAVSREHRRAKSDRLDLQTMMRAFLGWLRGEAKHCSMAAIPTMEEEDAKRPNREHQNLVGERTRVISRMKGCLVRLGISSFKPELRGAADKLAGLRTGEDTPLPPATLSELRRDMARLAFIKAQIKAIETERLDRLGQAGEAAPAKGAHAMVRLIARVRGIGIETADMLVNEVLTRRMRDRRALARYAGLTGAPDESGAKHREKGLARGGNGRVRRGMIQLAWRFLQFQKESALAQWFFAKVTALPRLDVRKKMIVALARKLLIDLWRMATSGVVPQGVVLWPEGAARAA